MEETTIVIMLKDEETGFLDQELGSYSVPERAELIWSIMSRVTRLCFA